MIGAITAHELRRLFYSPLAWTILAILAFILGLLFLMLIEGFITQIQPRFAGQPSAPGVTDAVITPLLFWAGAIMLGVAPLLTMRQISEERHNGSFALLTSAPLSATQIVLGKYLALLAFTAVMLGIILLMPLSVSIYSGLDWGKLACGMLGLFLLIASFHAAGLYLSCLTATPMIAAVSGFGVLLFLVVLYISGSSPGHYSELFIYLSHFGHFLHFLEGLFDTGDLAYYGLFIITFLTLTVRSLHHQGLR